MVTPFLPLVFLFDEFFGDMFFVVLVLTGSYILYVLYLNFHDQPMIFALAAIAGVTFLMSNTLLTTVLVTLFFVFVMFGQNLQMILSFAVYPLLGMMGLNFTQAGPMSEAEVQAMNMQQIEQRILKGEQVSSTEKALLTSSYNQQAAMEHTSQHGEQLEAQMMRRR